MTDFDLPEKVSDADLALCDEMIENAVANLRRSLDTMRRHRPRMYEKMVAFYRTNEPDLFKRLNLEANKTH